MVGGVFDRICAAEGFGCQYIAGRPGFEDGWYEGETKPVKHEYLLNGAHFGADDPDCCMCCGGGGHYCPAGYNPVFAVDENGRDLQPLQLIECRPVFGSKYWIGETFKRLNKSRCYCGCCPCVPEDLSFNVVKCEIVRADNLGGTLPPHPVSNADGALDNWDFQLTKGDTECYDTQKMGGWEAYVDPCGKTYPRSTETVAGVCLGQLGADSTDPEYTQEDVKDGDGNCIICPNKPTRRGRYIEAYGFEGKICQDGGEITDRPAFPFYDEAGGDVGMSIISSLCCCKTGNVVVPLELPDNHSGNPEDRIIPSADRCYAETRGTDFDGGPGSYIALCPSENAEAGATKFHHNGPGGGMAFPIDSHTETDFETDYNSFCGLECFRFTLFPKPKNKIPVLDKIVPKVPPPAGKDPTDIEYWKQIWTDPVCTPCSKRVMKFYYPPDDNNKVISADRQDPKCNAFHSWSLKENGNPFNPDDYKFNADHNYAQPPHQLPHAEPILADAAINSLGSHRMLYGTCKTTSGPTEFTITVTGSFAIGCDCQTGILSCYKSKDGTPENAAGNYLFNPGHCWRYASDQVPQPPPGIEAGPKAIAGMIGPCNPTEHPIHWNWGANCRGNGAGEPCFLDSDCFPYSKQVSPLDPCKYRVPCGFYDTNTADGAMQGFIGVEYDGKTWNPKGGAGGCINGPPTDTFIDLGNPDGYSCIKVWKEDHFNIGNYFGREVMVWEQGEGGEYEKSFATTDTVVNYKNICSPFPVEKLEGVNVPAGLCDGGECEEGWYQSGPGEYSVPGGNIIWCGGVGNVNSDGWCPPRCGEEDCAQRSDCAPGQSDCCGKCLNCYGEAENRVARMPGGACGYGFMANDEGNCWPSSDYMTLVHLNYIAEIS